MTTPQEVAQQPCKYGQTDCAANLMDCQCAIDAALSQQGEHQPVAWRLKDREASAKYGRDVYVYFGLADFKEDADVNSIFKILDPLYTAAPAPAPQPAQEQPTKVLLEHSGCGQGRQMEQLTIGLHRGDKVVLVMGEYTAALEATK